MRVLLFALVLVTVISCQDESKQEIAKTTVKTNDSAAANDEWIADFKKFRDAIYQNDKATIKSFIDFPLMNENNEIWDLAYLDEEIMPEAQAENQIKPFTEIEFDKRCPNIFPRHFTKSLLKVKTDSLLRNGQHETMALNEQDTLIYKMYTNVDSGKILRLHLWTNKPIKLENGEFDASEFSIIYEFDIINSKHLKFRSVRMAG